MKENKYIHTYIRGQGATVVQGQERFTKNWRGFVDKS